MAKTAKTPTFPRSGNLTFEELGEMVRDKTIDTVIVAFTDMQGRLVGKRVAARLFMEEVGEHGAECCNYLLAVDVEMNTVDGYKISSWERGYGDMAMIPDPDTLRLIPGCPVQRSSWPTSTGWTAPRWRRARARFSRRSWPVSPTAVSSHTSAPSSSSSCSRTATGMRGLASTKASPRPATTTSTTRSWHPPAWSRCCATSATGWTAAGMYCEGVKGSATWASRRSPSATRTRSTRVTTTRSTRTVPRRSPTSTARP